MSLPNQEIPRKRFEALDSLRFMAAMIALIAHAREMHDALPQASRFWGCVFHRESAIGFFFALSGFVLHLSWCGAWPGIATWSGFMVRRVFRLHPLYLVSLVLALLVVTLVPLGGTFWYQENPPWATTYDMNHFSLRSWMDHLLLITPGIETNFLNPPIWTLAGEMKVALIFPWLSWLIARLPMVLSLIFVTLGMLFAPQIGHATLPTASLLPVFMIGAWGAQHHERLAVLLKSRFEWRNTLLLLLGLTIYGTAALLRKRHDRDAELLQYQMAGAGSVLIMLAVIHVRAFNDFLCGRVLLLGGRLSYGIYVFHYPVYLGLLCYSTRDAWSAAVFFITGLMVTFILAWVLNRWLEVPMIKAGRSIANRISPTRPKLAAQG
ncbi:acyltransferase family protein [Brevifollis gellanilyticus]|nr:acyltransferase [Brevifollis gellanilyticus]